jgi:hypothetical protein
MKASLGIALAAAFMLAGCYESDDIVFPMDGGDIAPLKQGLYRCSSADSQSAVTYRVIPSEKEAKYMYAIVGEDGTGEDTTTLSFYRMAGDRYIGVAPRTEKGNGVPGQNIVVFHWDGTAFRTMRIKDERSEQLANQFGVAIEGFSYGIGGPIENQRAFVREVALDPSAEVTQSCMFVSP